MTRHWGHAQGNRASTTRRQSSLPNSGPDLLRRADRPLRRARNLSDSECKAFGGRLDLGQIGTRVKQTETRAPPPSRVRPPDAPSNPRWRSWIYSSASQCLKNPITVVTTTLPTPDPRKFPRIPPGPLAPNAAVNNRPPSPPPAVPARVLPTVPRLRFLNNAPATFPPTAPVARLIN